MSFQLVLEHLYGTLVVFSRYLSQALSVFRFSWKILVCAAMIVFMIKRQHTLQKKKEAAKRFSVQVQEYYEFIQMIRLFTQAYEAFKSLPEVAGSLKLQTLCLAALHKDMTRFISSPRDFLKKEQKSEISKLLFHGVIMASLQVQVQLLKESLQSLQFQVAETKNILKASQQNVSQVQREILYGLDKIAHLQENLKLLSQEAAKWTESPGGETTTKVLENPNP